jgi:hypothetical protein
MIIYKITNLLTGKLYIGQTRNSIATRWKCHKHYRKDMKSMYIVKAIRKHGSENFKIEEIERCNSIDELNSRETHWIRHLKTLAPNGYNLNEGGNNAKRTEETKNKISLSKMGKPSPKKGIPVTKEQLEKNRISHCVEIYCVETGEIFESSKQAAEILGFSHSGVNGVCLLKRTSIFGLTFRYVNLNRISKRSYEKIIGNKLKCL